MALRSIWKGSLRFSLVSVGVEAFTAAEQREGDVHLNQLHDECHSRIRYKKVCPIHGEVPNHEIVSGYEYEKDKYVLVDRNELQEERDPRDRTITIDTFVTSEEIDPIYYDGRTYYLTPDGAAARRPYAVLAEAMARLERYGVATMMWHGSEQLVVVRPIEGVLTMTMLHYGNELRSTETVQDDIPHTKNDAKELKLAQQLIEAATTDDFDLADYQDPKSEKLQELIKAKVSGKEVVTPPEVEEAPRVVNFMDALRRSVKQRKSGGKSKRTRARSSGARRRKSS